MSRLDIANIKDVQEYYLGKYDTIEVILRDKNDDGQYKLKGFFLLAYRKEDTLMLRMRYGRKKTPITVTVKEIDVKTTRMVLIEKIISKESETLY